MSEYTAHLVWQRGADEHFTAQQYSRRHLLRFDGGAEMAGSSSPAVVPLPWSDPAAVDPEEMFVASLSSCHMLWFLSIAAKRGQTVERYTDDAIGVMAKNDQGRWAMTRVTLRPQVEFGAAAPDADALAALHHAAHEACYIANSVRTEVLIEPQP